MFSVVRSKLIREAEDYQIRQLAQTPVQEKMLTRGQKKGKNIHEETEKENCSREKDHP